SSDRPARCITPSASLSYSAASAASLPSFFIRSSSFVILFPLWFDHASVTVPAKERRCPVPRDDSLAGTRVPAPPASPWDINIARLLPAVAHEHAWRRRR